MNNYKSQGQTFEQAGMNLDEGISVEDPLFKGCLNNLRKQQEEGFEIDMDAARTVVVAMEHDIAKVFEELRERVRKHEVKVAIVGGGGINRLVQRIIAEQHNLYSSHTWNFKDLANITKLGKPARDWEQSRLRRGKGHNKLKHKGKK